MRSRFERWFGRVQWLLLSRDERRAIEDRIDRARAEEARRHRDAGH